MTLQLFPVLGSACQSVRVPRIRALLLPMAQLALEPLLLGDVPLGDFEVRGSFNEAVDPRTTTLGRTVCSYVVVDPAHNEHPLLETMRQDVAVHGHAVVCSPDRVWRRTDENALIVYHRPGALPKNAIAHLTLQHGIDGNFPGVATRCAYRLIV